jgi:hypothetical protein
MAVDRKLTIGVQSKGIDKLLRELQNLANRASRIFGGPGTLMGGRQPQNSLMTLLNMMGTPVQRKNIDTFKKDIDGVQKKMSDLNRVLSDAKGGLNFENLLGSKNRSAANSYIKTIKDTEKAIASLNDTATAGGGGGGGGFLGGVLGRVGGIAGGVAIAGMVAKAGVTYWAGTRESVLYPSQLGARSAQTQRMALGAASGNSEDMLAMLAANDNPYLMQRAQTTGIRNTAVEDAMSIFGNIMRLRFEDAGAIWSGMGKNAGIGGKEFMQQVARTEVGTMDPFQRLLIDTGVQTAQDNQRAGYSLGGGPARVRALMKGGTKGVDGLEKREIAMGLFQAGGRSMATKELVEAVARGVESGLDRSVSSSAIALGIQTGGNFLGASRAAGNDPMVRNTLANAVMSNYTVGTWYDRGATGGAGFGQMLAFGTQGMNSTSAMRTVQENAAGAANLGGVFAGSNNNFQRAINVAAASGPAGGDPWVTSLLSRFGSNTSEVADFMAAYRNGKGAAAMPAYLRGAVTPEELASYITQVSGAAITAYPVDSKTLGKFPLMNALSKSGGDFGAAFTSIGAKTPAQQREAIAQSSGIYSVMDPSLEGNPELARERMSALAGLGIVGRTSTATRKPGGVGAGAATTDEDFQTIIAETANEFKTVAATEKANAELNQRTAEMMRETALMQIYGGKIHATPPSTSVPPGQSVHTPRPTPTWNPNR